MKKEELLVLAEYAFGEAMCVQERKVEPQDLNRALEQIVALIKKEVTEEFVGKWWKTFKALQSGKFRGLTTKLIKQMLEEAGVEIHGRSKD